jgi:hypothetical protein
MPVKEQEKKHNEEVEEVFGYHSPISQLLVEKFVHQFKEVGSDGQPVEVFTLGEAATGAAAELTPAEVQSELNDLVASA